MGIPVVYEDEWLLVVNKPAGLLVVPTPKIEKDTLTDILKLYPCHRLDRETSGLIIYAKNKSVQRDIARQFRLRQVKKKYIVFAQGQLRQSQGQIRIPLEGLSAVTRYRVVDRRKNFTVLEVEPLTGRTNQIRIHLKAIGHPVVGEKRFAFRRDFKLKANRLCLHAKSLEFRHPLADKKIILDSHLPLGMQNFLEKNPE